MNDRKQLIKKLQAIADATPLVPKEDPLAKEEAAAMKSATGFLARRNHTEYEIRCKLRKKKIDEQVISKVIARCVDLNYIDDEKTASIYIDELKSKGHGPLKIREALKNKRVPEAFRDQLLHVRFSDDEQRESAVKILKKRGEKFKREPDCKKRREKMYRFLCSRGFRSSTIFHAIEDLFP